MRAWRQPGRARLSNESIIEERRFKLLSFDGTWLETKEKRLVLQNEGKWLVVAAEEATGEEEDEDDEELIIV